MSRETLSEKNVLEILGKLNPQLLQTVTGEEYMTPEKLQEEIQVILKENRGKVRIELLPDFVNVEITTIDKQISSLTKRGGIHSANGWLMSQSYIESVCEEVSSRIP